MEAVWRRWWVRRAAEAAMARVEVEAAVARAAAAVAERRRWF